MQNYPDHRSNLIALKRVEGQIRGIQKMIEEGQYCVDILVQIHAVMSALSSVKEKVLETHFERCVTHAMDEKSSLKKHQKLKEIMMLIKKFRKL